MRTLAEYEEEKRNVRISHGTGIQCPTCGDELVESDPGTILTSNPPRKTVHCQSCNYKNTITA
jgi:DNA-directed RNA polymerase subunit RPC12/RpoP